MKSFRLSLILSFLLITPFPAAAGYCDHLFALAEKELAGLRPAFLAKHDSRYSLELPATAVKDQCAYGGCWVYGTTASIEAEFLKRTGKSVSLSEPYLILRSLEQRIDEALKTPGFQLGEGGTFGGAHALIEKYGALPTQAWAPRIPFETAPHVNRLLTFLNHRIAQYHLDVARLRDTPQRLRRQARKDLAELLAAYAGPVPKEFTYDGVKFASPQEFGAYVSPDSGKDITVFMMKWPDMPKPLWRARPKKGEGNKAWGSRVTSQYKYLNAREMEKAVVAALSAGKPVTVSAEIARAFIDRGTGIMAIKAMPVPKGFKPAPAHYRGNFGIAGGSHQMTIVGADLDAKGRVIKYKIKNSWGADAGEGGFYHMYPDYFRTFVSSIVVP